MIQLGLTNAELVAYLDALVSSHPMRVRVFVRDKNEDPIGEVTDNSKVRILEGAVQIDTTSDITRQLSVVLLDPFGTSVFDPNTPSSEALFADRFLRVTHETFVSSLNRWISCPIFHGPITKMEPAGPRVAIEALGKESLMLAPALQWHTRTFKKGMRITNVIRTLLEDKGEKSIDIPPSPRNLDKDLSVPGTTEGWRIIQKLAQSMDKQAYYDGRGMFHLRRQPDQPQYVFDPDVDVITMPDIPYDFTLLRNLIQIRGPKPDHGKQPIGTATAAINNAASAQSLGRNGSKRWLVEILDDDQTKQEDALRKQAQKLLDRALSLTSELAFESLVIPFLDELDPLSLGIDGRDFKFAMRKATIPLLAQNTMAIGFNKRSRITKLRPNKKRVTRHR